MFTKRSRPENSNTGTTSRVDADEPDRNLLSRSVSASPHKSFHDYIASVRRGDNVKENDNRRKQLMQLVVHDDDSYKQDDEKSEVPAAVQHGAARGKFSGGPVNTTEEPMYNKLSLSESWTAKGIKKKKKSQRQQQLITDVRDDDNNYVLAVDDDDCSASMCSSCCGGSSFCSSCDGGSVDGITWGTVLNDAAILLGVASPGDRRARRGQVNRQDSFTIYSEVAPATSSDDEDEADSQTFESYDDDDDFSIETEQSEVTERKRALFGNFGAVRQRDKAPPMPVCNEDEAIDGAELAVPSANSNTRSASSSPPLPTGTIPLQRVLSETSHLGSQYGQEVTEKDHRDTTLMTTEQKQQSLLQTVPLIRTASSLLNKLSNNASSMTSHNKEDDIENAVESSNDNEQQHLEAIKQSVASCDHASKGAYSTAAGSGHTGIVPSAPTVLRASAPPSIRSFENVIDLRTPKPMKGNKSFNKGQALQKRKENETKMRIEAKVAKAKKQKEAAIAQAKIDEVRREERERKAELKRIAAEKKVKEKEKRRAAALAEAEAKRVEAEALKAAKERNKKEVRQRKAELKRAAAEKKAREEEEHRAAAQAEAESKRTEAEALKDAKEQRKQEEREQKQEKKDQARQAKIQEKERKKQAKQDKALAATEARRQAAEAKRSAADETKNEITASKASVDMSSVAVPDTRDDDPSNLTEKNTGGDEQVDDAPPSSRKDAPSSPTSLFDSLALASVNPTAAVMLTSLIGTPFLSTANVEHDATKSGEAPVASSIPKAQPGSKDNAQSSPAADSEIHSDPVSQLVSGIHVGLFGSQKDDTKNAVQYSDSQPTLQEDTEAKGTDADEEDTSSPLQETNQDSVKSKTGAAKKLIKAGLMAGAFARTRSREQKRDNQKHKKQSTEKNVKMQKLKQTKKGCDQALRSTARVPSQPHNVEITGEIENSGGRKETLPSSNIVENKAVVYQSFNNDPENCLNIYKFMSSLELTVDSEDVLLKVQASTVSFSDCLIRQGLWWRSGEVCLPATPGVDVVGRVCGLNQNVIGKYGIATGDYVAALIRCGGNARYVKVHASSLVKIPKSVNPAAAACMVETYLSAFQSLRVGDGHSMRYGTDCFVGKKILIVGGISMVGQAMIELALLAGASTIYATARQKYHRFLAGIGASPLPIGIDEWLPVVSGQVDIAIDAYCIDHYNNTAAALKPNGKLVCVRSKPAKGERDLAWHVDTATRAVQFNNQKNYTYDLFESWEDNLQLCKNDLAHLFGMLKVGKVKPPIADCVTLTRVPQIHKLYEARRVQGFFVCKPWLK